MVVQTLSGSGRERICVWRVHRLLARAFLEGARFFHIFAPRWPVSAPAGRVMVGNILFSIGIDHTVGFLHPPLHRYTHEKTGFCDRISVFSNVCLGSA